MRFISTLHCETAWNLEGRLQGQIDTDLHKIGIEHAHRKALALQQGKWHIARIISSDLKRAIQTAEIINHGLNVTHTIDPRLRECHFGTLQGLEKSKIPFAYEKKGIHYEWHDGYKGYDYRVFGGENCDDVLNRQQNLLDDLSRLHSPETILLVGHGTSMNTLFFALGMSDLPMQRDEIRVLVYESLK